MNRIVSLLVGAAAVAGSSMALAATPASASVSPAVARPVESCEIIGNTNGIIGSGGAGSCATSHADSSYVLDYSVTGGNGSYAWHVPAGVRIVVGCSGGTPFCDVTVRSSVSEDFVTVSVNTFDTAGNPFTLSATADVPQVCGKFIC